MPAGLASVAGQESLRLNDVVPFYFSHGVTKAVVEKKSHFFINLVLAVFCLGVFTRSGNVFAEESGPADSGGTGLFSDTGENSLGSFTGCNSLFWLSAIAATFVFSSQGFDRNVHDYFAGGDEHETFISAAPAVGFFMPILLGAGLYFSGSAEEESKPYVAGCAVLQASFLALVSTSALKAVTGRPPALSKTKGAVKNVCKGAPKII